MISRSPERCHSVVNTSAVMERPAVACSLCEALAALLAELHEAICVPGTLRDRLCSNLYCEAGTTFLFNIDELDHWEAEIRWI